MKRLIYFLLFIAFFFLAVPRVSADENFYVDNNVNYRVDTNGKTFVVNNISIENKYTEKFSLQYYYLLKNINPTDIEVTEEGNKLNFISVTSGDTTKVTINFDKNVVGKGKSRQFRLTYSVNNFAVKSGEVWEISIPRVSDISLFRNYSLSLTVPKEFGEEAYLAPYPEKIEAGDSSTTYFYSKDVIGAQGLVAGFGKFQVFSFSFNYYLENKNNYSSSIEAAIPPDTAYQRMYYEKIDPAPENVTVDADGNWIASFRLKAKEKKNVKVEGSVQVFANPRKFLVPEPVNLLNNIKPLKYWEADEPAIKEIAKSLKTPEEIYRFVVTTLKYNRDRVKWEPQRLGAKSALFQPDNAICMEFTDLFIALSRASGIPAREINGFAYTQNPEIQPLSLINDVLHSWPEYWSDEQKTWIPVDPTWGATSGVDYFSKFDLRHFAFVIHGSEPELPLAAGFYKEPGDVQKNIFVNFGQLPERKSEKFVIDSNFSDSFFLKRNITVSVSNMSDTTIYDKSLKIYFDDRLVDEKFFKILPPYSKREIVENVGFSLMAKNTPKKISVYSENSQSSFDGPFNNDIIFQILIFFIVLSLLLFTVFRHFRVKVG